MSEVRAIFNGLDFLLKGYPTNCPYMLLRILSLYLFVAVLAVMPMSSYAQQRDTRSVSIIDTLFGRSKVMDRSTIHRYGYTQLTDLLKFELGMEAEQFPADGGARGRSLDLNSRYLKILVDGIPVGGADMFGGQVDIGGIALNDVEAIEISMEPQGVIYGSGTLAGIINIITGQSILRKGTRVRAYLQAESVGKEFNFKLGEMSKGKHTQFLRFDQSLGKHWGISAGMTRTAFNGLWGKYQGSQLVSGHTYQRGYEWSPFEALNGDASLKYQNGKWSAFYSYSHYRSDLDFYGHDSQQEFDGTTPLPIYSATDYRYLNTRKRHHLHGDFLFWQDAKIGMDLSLQEGILKRRIGQTDVATGGALSNDDLVELYATKTQYGRVILDKPFGKRLEWKLGAEVDRSNGRAAVLPGTFLSRPIDSAVTSLAGFTQLIWHYHPKLDLRGGMRWSGNGLSAVRPSGAFIANFKPNQRNSIQLNLELVHRFPNFRELFAYLENDFNRLVGDPKLKPETGQVLMLSWQHKMVETDQDHLEMTLGTGFRRLYNAIALHAVPNVIPTQDAFAYANLNSRSSWQNKIEFHYQNPIWKVRLGGAITGFKGNDFAGQGKYGRYLFHSEANALIAYHPNKKYWLQTAYHFVGPQAIYSFERKNNAPEIERVFNRSPAFHLLDISAGYRLFGNKGEISGGIHNLANVKTIDFTPTDGQEHYSGDLRIRYISYGRSAYLRLALYIH